jgi:hypothetical protein
MEWKVFQSSEKRNKKFFVYGNNGKYDNGGYNINFAAYTTSLTQFKTSLKLMRD